MVTNYNCDDNKVVTKLKLFKNSNCDYTQIVTELKLKQNLKWIKAEIMKN